MRRILLVDDSIDLRHAFVATLKMRNSKLVIVEARNGKEALEILAVQKFDVILTDLQMPLMDGEEFVLSARDLGIVQPIYMWSASSPNRQIAGIDKFFHKATNEVRTLIDLLVREAV